MTVYVQDASLRKLAGKVDAAGKPIGGPVPTTHRVDQTHSITIWVQAVEVPDD